MASFGEFGVRLYPPLVNSKRNQAKTFVRPAKCVIHDVVCSIYFIISNILSIGITTEYPELDNSEFV